MHTDLMFHADGHVKHVNIYRDRHNTTVIVERTYTPDLPNEPKFHCSLYCGSGASIGGFGATVLGAIKNAFGNRDV